MNEPENDRAAAPRETILVYHVGNIGDTVVAMPAFKALRHNFPGAAIRLANLAVADSLAHQELCAQAGVFADGVFWRPPRNLRQKIRLYARFLRLARAAKYSALYCFSPAVPKTLAGFWKLFQRAPIHHCHWSPAMGDVPLWQAYLNCLQAQGLTIPGGCFAFTETAGEREAAQKLARRLGGGKMMVFGIGGKQPACRWPLERYSQLIGALKEKEGCVPIYAGGEGERQDAAKLMAEHGGVFLYDTECRSLRGTLAFFRHCQCYVGNDTGAMHLAAAAGLPCAAIMPAHDAPAHKWRPFGERNLLLRKTIPCAGCGRQTCPQADPAPCVDFSAAEVAEKVTPWLSALS